MTQNSVRKEQKDGGSTLGERLLFAIWLAGKVLGTENSTQFADAIGKGTSQLSRWLKEEPRPSWGTIKKIADAIQISAVWLDDPAQNGSVVPDDFPAWLAARRKREAEERRQKRKASGER